MNRNKLKTYAPQARRDFIQAVTDRATHFGLSAKKIEPMTEQGEVVLIGGRPFPKSVGAKRKKLEVRIQRLGFEQTMEAMAYTWFNRLVAIRFMELHGYLEHGFRVLSSPEGHPQPEILEHAQHVDLPGLDQKKVVELKLDGTKEEELYRLLLITQCNALHKALPFLFESIDDETELLLPDRLLHSDSLIRNLVNEIPEEDWQEVEIIGWLYQFYISDKKDEVIGKVVASEDIPAATQLFTPNWIVKYLVQNTLGRQWLATYPNSPLKGQMKYYIEPAEQTPEVQEQLKAITPTSLDPEELTLLDPACGSGHILVEAYDLFKAIYEERGRRPKDIPALILTKNLFGLEIDDRAAQLAAFALMMKARADDRRIFDSEAKPNIVAIQDSRGLDAAAITHALNSPINKEDVPKESLFEEIDEKKRGLFSKTALAEKGHVSQAEIATLLELFENGKTFGSLIQIPPKLAAKLPEIEQRLNDVLKHGDLTHKPAHVLKPLLQQARLLSRMYDAVVANPPYLGSKGMNTALKAFAKDAFPDSKYNTFCMFIERLLQMLAPTGRVGMVTLQGWLFQDRYARFRKTLLDSRTLYTMAHLGPNAFPEISGEVVQATAFVLSSSSTPDYAPTFFALYEGDSEYKAARLLNKEAPITDIRFGEFDSLPDDAFLYWASRKSRELFQGDRLLGSVITTREGMATADNGRFLRFFWEVNSDCIKRDATSEAQAQKSKQKWFPYVKGGEFRKWFGNNELVVNWYNNGEEVKGLIDPKTKRVRSHNYNGDFGFRSGFTWSSISSNSIAARSVPTGFMFDAKGPMAYSTSDKLRTVALGLINSKVGFHFMRLIAPSLDFKLGHVEGIPFVEQCANDTEFVERIEQCIDIARQDWNEFETSPEFLQLPFARISSANRSLQYEWAAFRDQRMNACESLRVLEEANNKVLITLYGLQDELSPEVPDDQITLYRPDREEDIKRLLSYAIGCMMGRYSLDTPGVIFAGSESQGFDASFYKSFFADEDGILPLTEFNWFPDDAAMRFEKFIATIWPAESLDENLEFVAESLGPKKGESPRETIRRYLASDFFKHHLSMYKKRPIYWLFSSGKQRGFQALVYLHRYNEGTLARMRTEYVIPLLGKLTARIDHLTDEIASASSSQRRKSLETEKTNITNQRAEVQGFDEKLRHYADQRIKLNLDDGVKVNYGKFGDLLAEVKAVTGGAADE